MEARCKMNDWIRDAAALPIAFAQVREDPRLDMECCRQLPPNATVVMIASGGDTAVCLARMPLARLVLVDMNPAQLALTRCKLHLARHATREHALEWLGHRPAERRQNIECLLAALGLSGDALGPLHLVAERGPDFSGRYEVLFAALRARMRGEVRDRDAAFAEVMSLGNLVVLFGNEATQNPRVPFAEHFATRSRMALSRPLAHENPFLLQLFAGSFTPGFECDWLREKFWSPLLVEPEFVRSRMRDALQQLATGSVDFVHLSNILDWLAPDEATALLRSVHRVLMPGGMTLIRQLNSSLDIPHLSSGFRWDIETGRTMESRDRSFFYPEIHLGIKR